MVPCEDGLLSAATFSPDRLEALLARVQLLEERVGRLERSPGLAAASTLDPWAVPALAPETRGASLGVTAVMGLAGRACLILGGAFLLRTATDSGLLPAEAGVVLALSYGALWAFLADRQARKGAHTWAAFQLLTAAVIAFPMIWETTVRFHYLSPALAAGALLGATLLLTGVAVRHGLRRTGWWVLLGGLASALGLMAATSGITSFCAYFILIGAASLLVSDRPAWSGLRWPAALGADGAVGLMTWLALAPGGSEALANDLRGPRVLTLALALVGVYLGAILYRTLQRRRPVGTFEVFQSFAVLVAGFWGAARVAGGAGHGAALLGGAALLLGLGCHVSAFAWVDRQEEGSRAFPFLTSLGVVLVLAGGPLVLGSPVLGVLWLALGLAATFQAGRLALASLRSQGALLLMAAALATGLLARVWHALAASGPLGGPGFTLAALLALAGLLAGHGLALTGRDASPPLGQRLLNLAVGALGAFALAGLAVGLLAFLAKADLGALAAIRTAVLVALALGCAAAGRWQPASELPWLAYPVLGLTALKLLAEDFPHGRPATLFLALTLLGCGLLAVAKVSRPDGAGETPA